MTEVYVVRIDSSYSRSKNYLKVFDTEAKALKYVKKFRHHLRDGEWRKAKNKSVWYSEPHLLRLSVIRRRVL